MAQPKQMLAAVVTGPRQATVRQVPIPEPRDGDVRVRLEGCGVCASNLATWEGMPWTKYPTEPGGLGHEGWGRIDALGPGVSGWKVGDRVATLGQHSYAEYDTASSSQLVRLPDNLRDVPVPGEALACAFNVFARSQISSGQTVCVVGVGFMGAILIRLAAQAGARVLAVGRRPFALQTAARAGASELIPMLDHHEIIERVQSLTAGTFCDCVIEAVGKQWPLDLSAELTKERGRLIVAGYHQDGPRQINMQLWNWRGLDVINAHERDPAVYLRGMQAAFSALEAGQLDVRPLLTHSFTLPHLKDAFQAAEERPDGFFKAWIRLL
jgi:threonine dehydrogenase-like Zn-dependent dehydrogenase